MAILALLLVAIAMVAPRAAGAEKRAYAAYFEDGRGYFGVRGHWVDEDWNGIPCPNEPGEVNRVNTFVTALGEVPGTWVQLGYQERKILSGGSCVHQYRYYWEWSTSSGYNRGFIPTPVPPGNHEFSVNRRSVGCAPDVNWCWHFRIDDVTKHTCCGEVPELSLPPEVTTQTECAWFTGIADCPAEGLVDPINELAYKNSSDVWFDWNGRDAACVDFDKKARGKWNTETSVRAGYNVSMADSIQGCI